MSAPRSTAGARLAHRRVAAMLARVRVHARTLRLLRDKAHPALRTTNRVLSANTLRTTRGSV